jgi:hypothetical protein
MKLGTKLLRVLSYTAFPTICYAVRHPRTLTEPSFHTGSLKFSGAPLSPKQQRLFRGPRVDAVTFAAAKLLLFGDIRKLFSKKKKKNGFLFGQFKKKQYLCMFKRKRDYVERIEMSQMR